MVRASQQLDRRLSELRPLAGAARPSHGWIRAIREALGMTTGQLAKRLGVTQPRVVEMEKGEATANITVQSLERAAEVLGCRFVYAFVPHEPLTTTVEKRAALIAAQRLDAVDQSMRLEAQAVTDKTRQKEAQQQLVRDLLRRPARLWDEP